MTEFTVEAVLAPVTDGDWTRLRSVLDIVPGSLLFEDAEEPMLILPVDAESSMMASKFLEGLAIITGLRVMEHKVAPAPSAEELGLEEDDEPIYKTPAEVALDRYAQSIDPCATPLTEARRLIGA